MTRTRWASVLFVSLVIFSFGCAAEKARRNPLEGWRFCYSNNPVTTNELIAADYRGYISSLSPAEKASVGSIDFFEDGTGQAAVRIVVNLNGTRWAHILIYDKSARRTNVIRYPSSRYRS